MEKTKTQENFRLNHLAIFFKKNVFSFKALNKVLFVFIIVLGIFYIAGTNDLAIQGFALSDLKEQRNKLTAENKKMENRAMTLSSYNVISERIDNLKMVAVGEINYINGSKEVVARK